MSDGLPSSWILGFLFVVAVSVLIAVTIGPGDILTLLT